MPRVLFDCGNRIIKRGVRFGVAVKVVIVDRFRFVGEALQAFLGRAEEIEVAGLFHKADESTLQGLRAIVPDVILLESKTGGSAFVRRVREAVPAASVVTLASYGYATERAAALAAGAQGYVVQDHCHEEIVDAVLEAVGARRSRSH